MESVSKAHHAQCSQVCQEKSAALFKKPLLGENTKKTGADTAFLIVCNRSHSKMDAMIEGSKLASKTDNDCAGQVSSSKRGSKATILDGALEKERTFNDGARSK